MNDKELNDALREWLYDDMIIRRKNLEQLIDINNRLFSVERALISEEYAHKKEIIRAKAKCSKTSFYTYLFGSLVGFFIGAFEIYHLLSKG